jgi:hypothetical protein
MNASLGIYCLHSFSVKSRLIDISENLDNDLTRYMQRYFAKEVKQKQRENDIERGIEDYGPSYTHKECTIM